MLRIGFITAKRTTNKNVQERKNNQETYFILGPLCPSNLLLEYEENATHRGQVFNLDE